MRTESIEYMTEGRRGEEKADNAITQTTAGMVKAKRLGRFIMERIVQQCKRRTRHFVTAMNN